MGALNVAPEVERSFLHILKTSLVFSVPFTSSSPSEIKPDLGLLIQGHARINRAHDRILQKMFWTRVDVGRRRPLKRRRKLRRKDRRDSGAIHSFEGAAV